MNVDQNYYSRDIKILLRIPLKKAVIMSVEGRTLPPWLQTESKEESLHHLTGTGVPKKDRELRDDCIKFIHFLNTWSFCNCKIVSIIACKIFNVSI